MDEHSFRSEVKHECELPNTEDVLSLYISNGNCVNLRRSFRRLLLISETDSRSKLFFRSTYVIGKEKYRHLKLHYYMIHPLSSFTLWWSAFMMAIYFNILIVIPVNMVFTVDIIMKYGVALDLVCLIDMFISFNTGYIKATSSKIVLDRSNVFLYRLVRWVPFDLISSINYYVLLNIYSPVKQYPSLRYMSYFRFFRVFTFLEYFDKFCQKRRGVLYQYKLIKLVLLIYIIAFWGTGMIYIVQTENPGASKSNLEKDFFILYCLYRTLRLLLSLGTNPERSEVIFAMIEISGLTIGAVLQLMVISQIIQIVTRSNYARNKYYQLTQQLQDFMRYKNLPNAMRYRITGYFDYRFQKNYYNESDIMAMFSPQLRQEMLLNTHLHLLEKVQIFSELPVAVLYSIISQIRSEIYLPTDVIVTAGSLGECMLFISSGTAAVYTTAGKEVCHLTDGANFGELSLILETEHRIASVIAIDCCEVLILQRKDFMRQVEKFPEIHDRMKHMAHEKVNKTLHAEDDSEGLSLSSHAYTIDSSRSYLR